MQKEQDSICKICQLNPPFLKGGMKKIPPFLKGEYKGDLKNEKGKSK